MNKFFVSIFVFVFVSVSMPAWMTVFSQTVKVGVVLPLHRNNAEGMRMIEYYRGILLAADSLKQERHNIEITAVNCKADTSVASVLANPDLKNCDVIFGPLYSSQASYLSAFAKVNNSKLVIPFSINTPETQVNPNIFQIYQPSELLKPVIVENFMRLCLKEGEHQVVIVDCNDTTDFRKPSFTSIIKQYCQTNKIKVRITNVTQEDKAFVKAFHKKKGNIVVLNSASSPKMLAVFEKMKAVYAKYENINVKYLGYNEWLMYEPYQLDNFCKKNVYVPSTYYINPYDRHVTDLENKYRFWFRQEILPAKPQFMLAGFDHAYYFIKGIAKYGKKFVGTKQQTQNTPLQTPLHFGKLSGDGGYLNKAMMFIHYRPDGKVETINY